MGQSYLREGEKTRSGGAQDGKEVGNGAGLTDVEASELSVGAFGLVVMRCDGREGAAGFVDFCHWDYLP